jgi:hypothetical protein
MSIKAAISVLFGFLVIYITLTYIWVNMFKNLRGYITIIMDPDKPVKFIQADNDEASD